MTAKAPGAAPETIGDDLLEGVAAIATFIGLKPRRTQHLVDNGQLAGVFRMGRRIYGLKSEIRAGIEAKAKGEAAA